MKRTGEREQGHRSLDEDQGRFWGYGRFRRRERPFGKVILYEVLEDLEAREAALTHLHAVLHPQGQFYLMMAINIAKGRSRLPLFEHSTSTKPGVAIWLEDHT